MSTRYTPRKTWAALYGMRCDEAGVFRDQIRKHLRPDLIMTMRMWYRWREWETEVCL